MKSISSTFVIICTATISLCHSPQTFSDDIDLSKKIYTGTVDVGPRGFVDEEGINRGASYEIANRVVENAGFDNINGLVPFGRLFSYLENGKLDLAILVPNDKVKGVAIPITHILDVDFIAVGREGTQFDTLEMLEGNRVGHLMHSENVRRLVENLNVERFEAHDYKKLLKMLMAGRIDIIVGPKVNIFWNLSELDIPASKLGTPLSLKKIKLYLVYSRVTANEQTLSALKSSAEMLKDNGSIQAIIDRYDYSHK